MHKFARDDLSYAKVLVVDDISLSLEIAEELMSRYKMQVDCVTSGQAAIERIEQGNPLYNAIFMDYMMPEMDGIETVEHIRGLGTAYAKEIPIIALTAVDIAGIKEKFYAHGFQAYLSKPIDISRLDLTIRRWIKQKFEEELKTYKFSSYGKDDYRVSEKPELKYR